MKEANVLICTTSLEDRIDDLVRGLEEHPFLKDGGCVKGSAAQIYYLDRETGAVNTTMDMHYDYELGAVIALDDESVVQIGDVDTDTLIHFANLLQMQSDDEDD
jgi:hypothetical protein